MVCTPALCPLPGLIPGLLRRYSLLFQPELLPLLLGGFTRLRSLVLGHDLDVPLHLYPLGAPLVLAVLVGRHAAQDEYPDCPVRGLCGIPCKPSGSAVGAIGRVGGGRTVQDKLEPAESSARGNAREEPLPRAWRARNVCKVLLFDHGHDVRNGRPGARRPRPILLLLSRQALRLVLLLYRLRPDVQCLLVLVRVRGFDLAVRRHCRLP